MLLSREADQREDEEGLVPCRGEAAQSPCQAALSRGRGQRPLSCEDQGQQERPPHPDCRRLPINGAVHQLGRVTRTSVYDNKASALWSPGFQLPSLQQCHKEEVQGPCWGDNRQHDRTICLALIPSLVGARHGCRESSPPALKRGRESPEPPTGDLAYPEAECDSIGPHVQQATQLGYSGHLSWPGSPATRDVEESQQACPQGQIVLGSGVWDTYSTVGTEAGNQTSPSSPADMRVRPESLLTARGSEKQLAKKNSAKSSQVGTMLHGA
ncbi:hypothetical protein TREES_T100004168 [Tupaia chinensis]|uniref:Uncharacterized protein n=1 Tax=Tupaia chinensis TaxID=246437 RepID=L9KM56_TUPCH|nr:hypothetical protein TREES_T100004168 [Tupaia chinensis]